MGYSGKPKIRSGRRHPKMQKGKASGQDSLEPSEVFITSPANPHRVKSNFSPIRSFLEATKSPSMGSCSSRIAPEPKVSCQVSTHRRGRARVIIFGGLSVCLLESSQSLSLLRRQNPSSVALTLTAPVKDQSLQRFRAGLLFMDQSCRCAGTVVIRDSRTGDRLQDSGGTHGRPIQ